MRHEREMEAELKLAAVLLVTGVGFIAALWFVLPAAAIAMGACTC